MNDAIFSQIDFGPLKEFLEEDNVTDVSYSNGGQVWLKTLDKGVYRVDRPEINNALKTIEINNVYSTGNIYAGRQTKKDGEYDRDEIISR